MSIQRIDRGKGITYKIVISDGSRADGRQKRHTRTWVAPAGMSEAKAEKEARRAELLFEQEIKAGYEIDKRQTFGQYAEYYCHLRERNDRAISTYTMKSRLKAVEKTSLWGRKLADIKPQHINQFIDDLRQMDYSSGTINTFFRMTSAIFKNAEKEMLLLYNPCSKVDTPKIGKREPDYLQPEQVEAVLKALETESPRLKALIYFLAATGCRIGEAMAVEWADIDFKAKTVTISKSVYYTAGNGAQIGETKTGNTRIVSIPATLCEILKDYRIEWLQSRINMGDRWTGEMELLFCMDDGRPRSGEVASNAVRRFGDKIGIKLHPHQFRHTAASVLIQQGVDVVTVANRLGHSNIATTLRTYSHVIDGADKAAAEKLEVALRMPSVNNSKK